MNVELKARCADHTRLRHLAAEAGAVFSQMLTQTDTYFRVPHGRLKLREMPPAPAELIHYHRPDIAAARTSEYSIVKIHDTAGVRAMLAAALGIRCVVKKRRELLLWRNVRIHLDIVENLGEFLELESVVGPDCDPELAARNLHELSALLRLSPADQIPAGYADLIDPV